MSNKIINGKKPISTKNTKAPVFGAPDFFRDKFVISKELKEELSAKGYDWRFVNYKKYVENGGHDKGWQAYIPDNKSIPELKTLGATPDGIIRRGDSLFAFRPMDYTRQHKQYLDQLNTIQSGEKRNKAKAEELRQMAKESNSDVTVSEGYEDEA